MTSLPEPLLLKALKGETSERPPIWFMRQAGRCLPEYRELRAGVGGDFLTLCFNPEIATEITLQPMRRFAYDAAIVFSDIVPIALALGQKVWFEAGEGPRMGPLPDIEALTAEVEASTTRLAPIGETVRRVRAELEPERAVIGFAGGPWTVATYMLQGRGGEAARAQARAYAFANLDEVGQLVDVVTEATWRYLVMQVEAGAQAVQIFESWADQLPEAVQAVGIQGRHNVSQLAGDVLQDVPGSAGRPTFGPSPRPARRHPRRSRPAADAPAGTTGKYSYGTVTPDRRRSSDLDLVRGTRADAPEPAVTGRQGPVPGGRHLAVGRRRRSDLEPP